MNAPLALRIDADTSVRDAAADFICHALKHLGIGHTRISRGLDTPIRILAEQAAIEIDVAGNVRGLMLHEVRS